jgi:hypothetical protein
MRERYPFSAEDQSRSRRGGNRTCVRTDDGPDDGLVLLLGPEEIDACAGSAEALLAAVEHAAGMRGLAFAQPAAARVNV